MCLRHRHDLWLTRPAVSFGGGTTRESGGNRAYGNDCQIEPLGPDVFDVVSDVLEIVRDIITLSVLIVNIEQNEEF